MRSPVRGWRADTDRPVRHRRGTDSISTYAIDPHGHAKGPTTIKAAGKTPYGFDFTSDGTMIVTEAFGGQLGAAAASSYAITASGALTPISGSVADTRSEVCWAAVTKDGRFAYVTNFGDGTISSYEIGDRGALELRRAVAGCVGLERTTPYHGSSSREK